MFTQNFAVELVLTLAASLIALSVHEFFHAFAAYKLGDSTAKSMGRLSINPIKHLDPFGVLCMVFFHFGWAKPVPINSRYFKKPKRDMALVGVAGPASNLIMAIIFAALIKLLFLLAQFIPLTAPTWTVTAFAYLYQILYLGVFYNIAFAIFNLIPVPPLDGSRIATYFLPQRIYFKIMQYENFIFIGLMVALWFGVLDGPISFVSNAVTGILDFITRPIDWISVFLITR